MSIKISLYKLREMRYDVEISTFDVEISPFDVEISPSNYCRNIFRK